MNAQVIRAFQGLLSASKDWSLCCNRLSLERLDPTEAPVLESLFLREEVLFALANFSGDEVSGQDGLSMVY